MAGICPPEDEKGGSLISELTLVEFHCYEDLIVSGPLS